MIKRPHSGNLRVLHVSCRGGKGGGLAVLLVPRIMSFINLVLELSLSTGDTMENFAAL